MNRLMHSRNIRLAVALAVLALGGVAIFHHLHGTGADHGHGQHAGVAQLKLNAGKKWETDAPLRLGMERIRALTDTLSPSSTPEERVAFATVLREQVDFLIKTCKLPLDADETLHVLIGKMLEAADAVSQIGDVAGELTLLRKALETYPDYFDHPGWRQSQPNPA
jgi:hypothetical protein